MRHWTEVDCPNALDCFGGGRWGKGAYDHEESSEAGGKPWGICFCMTEQEHAEAQEELDAVMKTTNKPIEVEQIDRCVEEQGCAVIVRGTIVAWFPKFDEQEADWCRDNYFGAWLVMKARQPVIVPPSKEAIESVERCAAELLEILNDISQGEPLGDEFEAVWDLAKGSCTRNENHK